MYNRFYHIAFFVTALVLLNACKSNFVNSGNTQRNYRIQQDSLALYDSAMHQFIEPYKLQLDEKMNAVIGETQFTLLKERPEGSLCNMMADACLKSFKKKYNQAADIVVLNYGGVRIPSITAGNITLGKIYELMPFDNKLVVLEVNGLVLQQLLDLAAANGGWPVSGVRMKISTGKADSVFINGVAINNQQTYKLLTSDYMANGGDKATMLMDVKSKTEFDYLLRDAIIEFVKQETPIQSQKDGRVRN